MPGRVEVVTVAGVTDGAADAFKLSVSFEIAGVPQSNLRRVGLRDVVFRGVAPRIS